MSELEKFASQKAVVTGSDIYDPLPDTRFLRSTVSADGIEWHVVEGGRGPAVLLLHGWPLTWFSWRKVMPALVDAGYHVIAPDLPGLGASSDSLVGYAKRDLAVVLAAFMEEIGIARAAVVAHDMGAPVAYALARLFPLRLDRLAVLDVPLNGYGLAEYGRHFGAWHFDLFRAPALPETLIEGRAGALVSAFLDGGVDAAGRTAYVAAYERPGTIAASLAYYRAFPEDEAFFLSPAPKLEMPVLAIGGERAGAGMVLQSYAAVARDVRGAVVADCGHHIAEEQPDALLKILTPFLRETSL